MFVSTLRDIINKLNGKDYEYILLTTHNDNTYTFSKFDTFGALEEEYADEMDTLCSCLWADDDNVIYLSM